MNNIHMSKSFSFDIFERISVFLLWYEFANLKFCLPLGHVNIGVTGLSVHTSEEEGFKYKFLLIFRLFTFFL